MSFIKGSTSRIWDSVMDSFVIAISYMQQWRTSPVGVLLSSWFNCEDSVG